MYNILLAVGICLNLAGVIVSILEYMKVPATIYYSGEFKLVFTIAAIGFAARLAAMVVGAIAKTALAASATYNLELFVFLAFAWLINKPRIVSGVSLKTLLPLGLILDRYL